MNKERVQLIEEIMQSLGDLQRCFATSRDSYLAKFDISRPQLELLYSLKHHDSTTGDLAKRFSISSSAVSQMADQLERKKLIERLPDDKDKRITRIRLAGTAKSHFGALRKRFIEHLSGRFVDITDEELAALKSALTKTVTSLEKDKTWKK